MFDRLFATSKRFLWSAIIESQVLITKDFTKIEFRLPMFSVKKVSIFEFHFKISSTFTTSLDSLTLFLGVSLVSRKLIFRKVALLEVLFPFRCLFDEHWFYLALKICDP